MARIPVSRLDGGDTTTPAPAPAPARVDTSTLAGVLAASGETPTPVAQPFTQPMTIAGQTPAPATDPLKNKAVKPQAPAGYEYAWIGGTTTDSWQLYKSATPATGGGVVTPTTPTAQIGRAHV